MLWDEKFVLNYDGYLLYCDLSVVFFENLVLLVYCSGYMLMVNVMVMVLVGVSWGILDLLGGEIFKDEIESLIGVFCEMV